MDIVVERATATVTDERRTRNEEDARKDAGIVELEPRLIRRLHADLERRRERLRAY